MDNENGTTAVVGNKGIFNLNFLNFILFFFLLKNNLFKSINVIERDPIQIKRKLENIRRWLVYSCDVCWVWSFSRQCVIFFVIYIHCPKQTMKLLFFSYFTHGCFVQKGPHSNNHYWCLSPFLTVQLYVSFRRSISSFV